MASTAFIAWSKSTNNAHGTKVQQHDKKKARPRVRAARGAVGVAYSPPSQVLLLLLRIARRGRADVTLLPIEGSPLLRNVKVLNRWRSTQNLSSLSSVTQ